MRSPVPALAVAAVVLASLSAQAAEDDNPFADPSSSDVPPLSTLPELSELPPLSALPPLDGSGAQAPRPAAPEPAPPVPAAPPAARPTILPSPAPPSAASFVQVPAAPQAQLGQYNEYRRALGSYSIDRDPVSVAQYERCVADGHCTRASCGSGSGLSSAAGAPEACVDLTQAQAYCASESRRLPTEDEWEHAAREAQGLGLRGMGDHWLEWTSSPYCFFCGRNDEVVRGGPARNAGLRGWREPAAHEKYLGFRCAG